MGKMLIVIGLVIASLGALIMLGVPLGRLPGDIVYRRGVTSVYVPLTTSVCLSILLTAVLWLLRR